MRKAQMGNAWKYRIMMNVKKLIYQTHNFPIHDT